MIHETLLSVYCLKSHIGSGVAISNARLYKIGCFDFDINRYLL